MRSCIFKERHFFLHVKKGVEAPSIRMHAENSIHMLLIRAMPLRLPFSGGFFIKKNSVFSNFSIIFFSRLDWAALCSSLFTFQFFFIFSFFLYIRARFLFIFISFLFYSIFISSPFSLNPTSQWILCRQPDRPDLSQRPQWT